MTYRRTNRTQVIFEKLEINYVLSGSANNLMLLFYLYLVQTFSMYICLLIETWISINFNLDFWFEYFWKKMLSFEFDPECNTLC